eukprot:3718886-Amphidinium_carterae.1
MKTHQTQQAVIEGRVLLEDFHGNQEADVMANLGAAEHDPHQPSAEWFHWELVSKASDTSGVWLPVPEPVPAPPPELPVEVLPKRARPPSVV